MEIVSENEFNAVKKEEIARKVVVHNAVLNEDLFVLLEPYETEKIDLNAIRDFVLNAYTSNFNETEIKITYYQR